MLNLFRCIIVLFLLALVSATVFILSLSAREHGERTKPTQPIHFSHLTHVEKNKIECEYCHWTVAKSQLAGIPELQSCVGCHNNNFKINMGQSDEQKSEIAKIASYFDRAKPVPWLKVNTSPEYLRFSHKRHTKAGVSCRDCHGQVSKMEVVERVSSFKMGWCTKCHMEQGASRDCLTCHK